MARQPFLDNWGRYLLGAGCGAGLMLLFVLADLNPGFLFICWLVAMIGWLFGRLTRDGCGPKP